MTPDIDALKTELANSNACLNSWRESHDSLKAQLKTTNELLRRAWVALKPFAQWNNPAGCSSLGSASQRVSDVFAAISAHLKSYDR